MVKQRIVETNQGIQGELDVSQYNNFARQMKDRGWLSTDQIIHAGIASGHALEVGSGPGYLGLEWLKKTKGTTLTAIEISANMISLSKKNANEYGFDARVQYVLGNAMKMPFDGDQFGAAFSNGSLHEWESPERILLEIYRVLKPGGRVVITDLRRDISLPIKLFLNLSTQPNMRKGLKSSLEASYTVEELKAIMQKTPFKNVEIRKDAFGLSVSASK